MSAADDARDEALGELLAATARRRFDDGFADRVAGQLGPPAIDGLVGAHACRRFQPGFDDRVLARVAGAASFDECVVRDFRWLAAAASLAAVLLGAYSVVGALSDGQRSALEAAFGLEPISLESIYELDQSSAFTETGANG